MSRFILFFLSIFILFYALRFLIKATPLLGKKTPIQTEPEELVQDPNCQTYIPKGSALKIKMVGRIYYFCDQKCLENYFKNLKKNY
jgi:YHS domain-containing protein